MAAEWRRGLAAGRMGVFAGQLGGRGVQASAAGALAEARALAAVAAQPGQAGGLRAPPAPKIGLGLEAGGRWARGA